MVTNIEARLPEAIAPLFREQELPRTLDWITSLSPLHQRLMIMEIALIATRAAATEMLGGPAGATEHEFAALLDSWKATAEVDSDAELAADLLAPDDTKQFRAWS